MTGFAILLAFNLLGVLLHRFAHVPLPDNVLGMLLLLAALGMGIIKLHWVEDAANFLLHHMMLFFAPILVGVLPLMPVLQANLAPIAVGMMVSTFVTMLVTGLVAQYLLREGAAHG